MHCPFLLCSKDQGTTRQEQVLKHNPGQNCALSHMPGSPLTAGALTYAHSEDRQTDTDAETPPSLTPSLSGHTMLRSLAHHDDQLTALGVQVLQAEGSIGNNHG